MAKKPKVPKQLENVFSRLGPHDSHPWQRLPWKGVFNKVLYFDPVTGATIELARIAKGAEFPEHYHTTVQTLFLVTGTIETRTGDKITAGTFNVIPAGQLHGPFHAIEEAVQFKYFSGTPVYILRDGTTYIYRYDGTVIEAGSLPFIKKVRSQNFISS